MITLGPVAQFVKDGKPVRAATLHSTFAGREGREELIEFGVRLGLRTDWLKLTRTSNEHFAVQNARIEKAVALGAQRLDRDALASLIKRKQELLGLVSVSRRTIVARSIVREMQQRRQSA